MRRTIRKLALPLTANMLSLSGWTARLTRRPGTHLLYLHHVSDIQWFDRWLGSMSKRFELIDHNLALDRIQTGRHPCAAVSISFDDGFASCWQAAEVLEKYNARGLFYICPDVVGADQVGTDKFFGFAQPEAVMNWSQIQSLVSRGHLIGGHTCTHPNLAEIPSSAAAEELTRCKQVIEAQTKQTCDHFAWPYGRRQAISEDVIQLAYSDGYRSVASGIRGSHAIRHNGVLLRNVVADGEPISQTMLFLALAVRQWDSYNESRTWALCQTDKSKANATNNCSK